jgi:membrane associated rhomboid family serine protease
VTDPFPADDGPSTSIGPSRSSTVTVGLMVVAIAVAAMWIVELVDTVLLDDRLQGNGIQPRRRDGLDGVVYAPMLHLGWPHLIANTVPFIVLGGLVTLWGWRRWFVVTTVTLIVGGGLTWLLARSGNHIGASGLVFGYFGYLVGAVFYQRRLWPVVPAAVAIVAYGSAIVAGIAPTDGVSWEGHAFGAAAGVLAAKTTSSVD